MGKVSRLEQGEKCCKMLCVFGLVGRVVGFQVGVARLVRFGNNWWPIMRSFKRARSCLLWRK